MHARAKRIVGWLAALALVLGLASTGRTQGIDQVGSLKLVPADAAFYASSLRMKEQLDIVLKSKAWAKLSSLPFVQQGMGMLHQQMQTNPQAGMVQQMLAQPENQQLLAMLGDMVSHEIFVYGDAGWGPLVKTLAEAQSSMQFGPASVSLNGGTPDDAQKAQFRGLLRMLQKSKESLRLAPLVLGFRLTDEKAAQAQLKRLEEMVKNLPVPQEHPLHKMLAFKTIGSGKFMTFEADGSMVPWDQIPIGNIEETPGEFKPLIDHLRGQKLRIALGYSKGFMFFLLGDSFGYLEKLGSGSTLLGQPELKPLLAHADKRLNGVSYISKAFRESAASGNMQSLNSLVQLAKQGMDQIDLTAEQKARINKDLASLLSQVQGAEKKIGGAMSYSFLTDRGTEGYSYDWMASNLDGSKPLTLLNHVGAAPILAAVARTKTDPGAYEKMEDIVSKLYQYGVEIGLPKVPAEHRAHVQMALEKLVPIVKKMSTTTKKYLIPGLADGQIGFVIDGKLNVSRLHMSMPAFPKPMPLPELAILLGVSDAKAVKTAFGEYRSELNELFAAIREINPMAPEIQIPEAKSMESKGGVTYSFPIFGQLGLDPQIMPAAGLSDKVAVIALSPDHVSRLLGEQPLKVDGGPLADLMKPRAAATAFNGPAFIDLLAPWTEFGIEKAQEASAGQANPDMIKMIKEQLKVVFDVLKVFKGSTSSTYLEDGAVVTHSESVVKDI